MFFGRECFHHADILLEMLARRGTQSSSRSSFSHLKVSFLKAYVRIFGTPDVGLQLRALYFRKFLREFVKTHAFNRILDVGCGLGYFSFYLGKKSDVRATRIDAFDVNEDYIKAGQDVLKRLRLTNVHLFKADLLNLDKFNEYNLILAIEVLEHIENDKKAIKNLCNALKKGGVLFLHVPQRPLKRFFKSYDAYCGELHEHVRKGYSQEELIDLLEDNGLKIEKTTNTFGHFGSLFNQIFWLVLQGLPLEIAALVFPVLSIVLPLDFATMKTKGNGLLIIAQK